VKKRFLSLALVIAAFACIGDVSVATAAPPDDAKLKKALEDEMARSLGELRLGADGPPYYLRYSVTDSDTFSVGARLGAVTTENLLRPTRHLAVEVRVGSRDQDNTNIIGASPSGIASVTREDDPAVLRHDLWDLTDQQYKRALESLGRKKASRAIQAEEKDKIADFTATPALQLTANHALVPTDADRQKLKDWVVKLSAVFREASGVDDGRVFGGTELQRRRILTNEKTWIDESRSRVSIVVFADTVAKDGQHLGASALFTAASVGGLPPFEKMEAEVKALAKTVADTRNAPTVEAGSASVIFEGTAAPELARLLLAGALSGQPLPRSLGGGSGAHDGSTSLADKLGFVVAPKWFEVVDDPKALGPNKRPLFGNYDSDDEGVAAERTVLVEHGVVKSLLMSRAPRKEILKSNGHGRGFGNVGAHAGNLFVSATNGVSRADLLAQAVRSAGPKGTVYIVKELGAASGIGRGQTLQAKVAVRYKDGKEEAVRGLSLEGFVPKKLKKDLVAAGRDLYVLDDDSGVPTSTIAPALLFEDVDVGRPNDKNRTPPLYPSPLAAGEKR
jgi:predicted Zn-dependent protease